MFKTKSKRISAINQVACLAMKLNVNFRSSPYGISIIGDNETKCFKATEEQLQEAHKFIYEQAEPSLQTVLKPFYG